MSAEEEGRGGRGGWAAVPDFVIGEGSVWESRGLGAAMLAGRELSSSSSSLLPPLMSFTKSPCKRLAFTAGVGVSTYAISHASVMHQYSNGLICFSTAR